MKLPALLVLCLLSAPEIAGAFPETPIRPLSAPMRRIVLAPVEIARPASSEDLTARLARSIALSSAMRVEVRQGNTWVEYEPSPEGTLGHAATGAGVVERKIPAGGPAAIMVRAVIEPGESRVADGAVLKPDFIVKLTLSDELTGESLGSAMIEGATGGPNAFDRTDPMAISLDRAAAFITAVAAARPWESVVTAVSTRDERTLLTVANGDVLRQGDELEVLSVPTDVKDPASGRTIGRTLSLKVGTCHVVRIAGVTATADAGDADLDAPATADIQVGAPEDSSKSRFRAGQIVRYVPTKAHG